MKLGIISSMAASQWGGSEELWLAIAQSAIKVKHEVAVSVYDWGQLPFKVAELQKKGVVVHKRSRFSFNDIRGKIKGQIVQKLLAERQLNSFIKEETPDYLILSTGAFCDLEINPLRTFLLKIDIPFFILIHSNTETHTFDYYKLEEIRSVCQKAKEVFFVSERLKQQAERQIAYSFSNSSIVKNPVSIDSIDILPFPVSEKMLMACVGTLQVSVKGQGLLLQILSSEKWKSRNWQLNIYGSGPDERLINELISFYGLQEKVVLRGHVKNIRENIWKNNHILLMPSFIEGMPISLVEAMLCGRPAVVTDVGGNRELLEDGLTGYIAESSSSYSFENALEKAWAEKMEWKKMGDCAHTEILKYYSADATVELLNYICSQVE